MMIRKLSNLSSRVIICGALSVLGLGLFGFSSSAHATTTLAISNSGETISFDKVQPSSTGTITKAIDNITIDTNCTEGINLYISAVNGGSTSLTNSAVTNGNNGEITTLANTTIGSTALALSNNTWGFNTVDNNTYYGLPTYADAMNHIVYSGANSNIPIYYGAKVTNTIATGTYTGKILYTASVNTSCLGYDIVFNKNAQDATGSENSQTVPLVGGELSKNVLARDGYTFLGWSINPEGKTGTATNGIGTIEDVDYLDEATFPDLNITPSIVAGSETTLYAIWKKLPTYMQEFTCDDINPGQIITLLDRRDGTAYKVKRVEKVAESTMEKDYNKCWMLENLRYVGTDSDPGTTVYDSSSSPNEFTTDLNSQVYGHRIGLTTKFTYSSEAAKYPGNKNYGAYYNWEAAKTICPDGWHLPVGGTDIATNEFSQLIAALGNSNLYSTLTGSDISNGQLNFKLTGYYYSGNDGSSSLQYSGRYGRYWSSTYSRYYDSNSYGYILSIDSSSSSVSISQGMEKYGFPVRCIANQISDLATGWMQDFDASSDLTEANATMVLADKRDYSNYVVKRLPDGKVWMVQNVHYMGTSYDPGKSRVSSDSITFTTDSNSQNSGVTIRAINPWNGSGPRAYYRGADSNESYYSWDAAVAICPAGWHLPSGGPNGEYVTLDKAYGGNGVNRYNANTYDKFIGAYTTSNYARFYSFGTASYGISSSAYYWSSTSYNDTTAFNFKIDGSNSNDILLSPQATGTKTEGYMVRCIANTNAYLTEQRKASACASEGGMWLEDKKCWKYGNNGDPIAWNTAFTSSNNSDGHNATIVSGYCPAGYSAPSITDFDRLAVAYGGESSSGDRSGYTFGSYLYNQLGLSNYRMFWSSTERDSNKSYYLSAYNNGYASTTRYSQSKSNSYYLLCYKNIQ